MKDKIVLITGATSGIGRAGAEELAAMGAHIVMTTRSMEKAEKNKQEIIESTGNGKVNYYMCELSSFESVRKFAEDFRQDFDRLDVLINNAGLVKQTYTKTDDNIETTFQVNHLSHFLLTNLLLDLMKQGAPSRIINVSSEQHKNGSINFDNINLEGEYNIRKSYAQSKLANILFTNELAERLKGSNVTVNAMHPGGVATNLYKEFGAVVSTITNVVLKSPKKGAETMVYLATSDEVKNISGEYFQNKKIIAPSTEAKNRESASSLWKISEDYTGLSH